MDSSSEAHESPWRGVPAGETAPWKAPDVDIVRSAGRGDPMRHYDLDGPFLDMNLGGQQVAANTEAPPITRLGAGNTALAGAEAYEAPIIRGDSHDCYRDVRSATSDHGSSHEAPYHIRGDARAEAGTTADTEVVYEGSIVREGPSLPFDRITSIQPKLGLIGDKDGVANTVFETVNTRAEDHAMGEKTEPVVVVAVRFNPATPSRLVTDANPELYKAVDAGVAHENGLLSALTGTQKAEVIADAASGGDPAAANAYEHILSAVIRDVEKNTGAPATPQQIRDFVRHLREARRDPSYGEMPTIDGKAGQKIRTLVDDALWDKSREVNEPHFEPLGQWLDKAMGDSAETTPPEPEAGQNGHRPNVTVVDVGVHGHKRGLKAQSDLAANTLLALVADKDPNRTTPWGKIGGVALLDADLGDPETVKEILRHCKGKMPVIVSVDELNPDTAHLIRGSDMYGVVMPADSTDVEALSSMLPKTLRDDVTGESQSKHANRGNSRNNSVNFSYSENEEGEKGGGRSHTRDSSSGETYDRSQSRTIGQGSVLLPHEIEGSIQPGELGLISRDGTPRGVYDTGSRGLVDDRQFPPPAPEKLDVTPNIEAIRGGRVGQTAIGAYAEGDPSAGDLEEAKLPFSLQHELDKLRRRKLGQAWAEKGRYEKEFSRDMEAKGKSVGASVRGLPGMVTRRTTFPRWLRQRYALEHQQAQQTYTDLVAAAQQEYGRPLHPQEQIRIWRTIADGGKQENRSLGSHTWTSEAHFLRDFDAWRRRRGH